MILPTKHINFSKSLLGLGAYILEHLDRPRSIDELWGKYNDDRKKHPELARHTFDNLVMTLLFLYCTECVTENGGMINKCA